MTRYFPREKLLSEECPRAGFKDTPQVITFLKGNHGSYFPSARVISGLCHAFEDW